MRVCFLRVGVAFPVFLLAILIGGFHGVCADELNDGARNELRKEASWDWPNVLVYEEQLLSYLEQRQADEAIRTQVVQFWRDTADAMRGPDLLTRLLDAASIVDPRIGELRDQLQDPRSQAFHPRDKEWLTSDVPGWMQDTIRLACGRAFAQRQMYDESLETLTGLELVQVCDPSTLIFYRATCEHHLLRAKECLANLDLLLERKEELPNRYAQLAELMRSDIKTLEEDSLDEVARLMRDVERRLELGRAGKRVRDEEQEIVDKLDQMIDQIEQRLQEQQQQQQNQSGKQSQGQPQGSPMEDSQLGGPGGGPGDVDQKNVGDRSGWGNLPPAQRQESLQRLTEELPSHYRSIIEGYFKQLAEEKK